MNEREYLKGEQVIAGEPETELTDSVISSSSPVEISEPNWMQFAGIFENDLNFQAIMKSIRAERTSNDDSEVNPSYYL
jgi:hypothetical protein